MDPIPTRPAIDPGERTLRRLARAGLVLSLCWAAGGAYLVSLIEPGDVLGWTIVVVAVAPLYVLYAVAGEVLGAAVARRWTRALRIRIPPRAAEVLHRRAGGPGLLLLAVPAAIALAWLIVRLT